MASLSLTPLIDVVFLLLIFFLVATRFAEEERELDVLLPQASEANFVGVRCRIAWPCARRLTPVICLSSSCCVAGSTPGPNRAKTR